MQIVVKFVLDRSLNAFLRLFRETLWKCRLSWEKGCSYNNLVSFETSDAFHRLAFPISLVLLARSFPSFLITPNKHLKFKDFQFDVPVVCPCDFHSTIHDDMFVMLQFFPLSHQCHRLFLMSKPFLAIFCCHFEQRELRDLLGKVVKWCCVQIMTAFEWSLVWFTAEKLIDSAAPLERHSSTTPKRYKKVFHEKKKKFLMRKFV